MPCFPCQVIFAHSHLVKAYSFPRASPSENCSLLETDIVRGQISEHIFAPNGGYCLYSPFRTSAYGLSNNITIRDTPPIILLFHSSTTAK